VTSIVGGPHWPFFSQYGGFHSTACSRSVFQDHVPQCHPWSSPFPFSFPTRRLSSPTSVCCRVALQDSPGVDWAASCRPRLASPSGVQEQRLSGPYRATALSHDSGMELGFFFNFKCALGDTNSKCMWVWGFLPFHSGATDSETDVQTRLCNMYIIDVILSVSNK